MPDKVIRTLPDAFRVRIPPWAKDEPTIQKLMDDMRARHERGEPHQITPILLAPCADDPDPFDLADGLHRLTACVRLGLPISAEIRDKPFAKGEVNRIRASSLMNRKKASAFELAAIVTDFRKEMGLETWDATAAGLGLTAPTVSRILCVNRYPDRLRAETEGLGLTVVQTIGGKAKTVEHMEKALAFAKQNNATKDAVIAFLKSLEGDKEGKKPKALKGIVAGRKAMLTALPDESAKALGDYVVALGKQIAGFGEIPAASLDFLFK